MGTAAAAIIAAIIAAAAGAATTVASSDAAGDAGREAQMISAGKGADVAQVRGQAGQVAANKAIESEKANTLSKMSTAKQKQNLQQQVGDEVRSFNDSVASKQANPYLPPSTNKSFLWR